MKKLLLFPTIFLLCLPGFSQSKEEVYDKIEGSYAWLNRKLLDVSATITMTEEQWAYALKNENVGLSTVNSLGSNLANFYEITQDDRILSDCRYKSTPNCEARIDGFKPKIFVTADLTKMGADPSQIKLAMYGLGTLSSFLGNDNIYGTKAGWRPKGDSVKFAYTVELGKSQPKVVWKPDGSEVSVTMFVTSEAPDWAANMLKALHKGK